MLKFNTKLLTLVLALAAQCHAEVSPEYILRQKIIKSTKLGEYVAIYAYPLVSMGLLKQYNTYAATSQDKRAPINQFAHERAQPTPLTNAEFPTIDTLSSTAWLDLSKGPMVLQLPSVYKRFYMFELFDAWTNVITTLDTSDQDTRTFLICGPNFKGTIPRDMQPIRSKTDLVYIKGRTQCFGPSDYENIQQIQNKYILAPYSQFSANYTPPFFSLAHRPAATREAPHYQIDEINYISYFNRFADLLHVSPPSAQDVVIARALDELGICPEEPYNAEGINRTLQNGLENALCKAVHKIDQNYESVYTTRNRWEMLLRKESDFGTDYVRRAYLARACLPLSLSQNVLCMTINCDRNGDRFHGTQKYLYHIHKNELPPVDAFWSLTIYNDMDGLVCNPANIYAIQSFSDNLIYNEDGSLDIWIQQHRPESECDKVNWLPCPNNGYTLMFRFYKPSEKIINGEWLPPPLKCLDPFTY